jgi:hypothetical protein
MNFGKGWNGIGIQGEDAILALVSQIMVEMVSKLEG